MASSQSTSCVSSSSTSSPSRLLARSSVSKILNFNCLIRLIHGPYKSRSPLATCVCSIRLASPICMRRRLPPAWFHYQGSRSGSVNTIGRKIKRKAAERGTIEMIDTRGQCRMQTTPAQATTIDYNVSRPLELSDVSQHNRLAWPNIDHSEPARRASSTAHLLLWLAKVSSPGRGLEAAFVGCSVAPAS